MPLSDDYGSQHAPDQFTTEAEYFRQRIRAYLQRRLDNGNRYVKAGMIADALGVQPVKAGANLSILAERGLIEKWNESNSGTVWRIVLDELEEVDDGE